MPDIWAWRDGPVAAVKARARRVQRTRVFMPSMLLRQGVGAVKRLHAAGGFC
jgi:hypothetical protein